MKAASIFREKAKIKITTKLSKYGNPVTEYEVNPESIEGCVWLYESICTYSDMDNNNKITIGDVVTCTLTESIDKFYVIENASSDVKSMITHILDNELPYLEDIYGKKSKYEI